MHVTSTDNDVPAVTAPSSPVLDEPSAAIYIGYSVYALKLWRGQGRGPSFVRVGRTIRYRVSDLDRWIEDHVVTPASTVRSRAS